MSSDESLEPIEITKFIAKNTAAYIFPLNTLFHIGISMRDIQFPLLSWWHLYVTADEDLNTIMDRFHEVGFEVGFFVSWNEDKELDLERLKDWDYLDEFFTVPEE